MNPDRALSRAASILRSDPGLLSEFLAQVGLPPIGPLMHVAYGMHSFEGPRWWQGRPSDWEDHAQFEGVQPYQIDEVSVSYGSVPVHETAYAAVDPDNPGTAMDRAKALFAKKYSRKLAANPGADLPRHFRRGRKVRPISAVPDVFLREIPAQARLEIERELDDAAQRDMIRRWYSWWLDARKRPGHSRQGTLFERPGLPNWWKRNPWTES